MAGILVDEVYELGDFKPSKRLQTFSLPVEDSCVASGTRHALKYTYRGTLKDEDGSVLCSLCWFLKVNKNRAKEE
ncbi:hypothetical protein Q1695_001295 [Nippostrongylus brasiliensis]|nr:hypothetical protein Q1695_001295 [Nippostrongylus brasiliensis]